MEKETKVVKETTPVEETKTVKAKASCFKRISLMGKRTVRADRNRA